MSATRKISVELTEDAAQAVQGAVEAGEYATPGDAVRAVLSDWTEARRRSNERLRQLIQEGIDSGPGIDADVFFDRLEARYADLAQDE
jgi:antitoxin ParD1/3/4